MSLALSLRALFGAMCLSSAIVFGLCSPVAADLESAKSHFQRLPEDRRFMIPLMLIATGYYNGMSTGEFNTRIYQGIARFQRDQGIATTGALDEVGMKLLNLRGGQAFAAWGMKETIHPNSSAKLYIPLTLLEPVTRDGPRLNYEAADGSMSVNFSFVNAGEKDLQQLYAQLSAPGPERQVGYNVIRDRFFVVAGVFRGRDYYSRYHPVDGGSVGFTLAWDKARVPLGDRIAALMSNLFFTGIAPALAAQTSPDAPKPPSPSSEKPSLSSGTGFSVSDDGMVLTNAHVVEHCNEAFVRGHGLATIKSRDTINDLALLKVTAKTKAASFRKEPVGLGDRVYVLGFPYADFLSGGVNFTDGLISALAGIRNDTRYLQFTAPVQPGNSGGPLVDASGNVVAVVSSRLNEVAVLKQSGSLPQNVNFAVRGDLAMSFLRANGISPVAREGSAAQSSSDIARDGQDYTVHITCVPRATAPELSRARPQ